MNRMIKIVGAICVCFVIVFVVHIPVGISQVTAPEEFLGYSPGDDFQLAPYEQWVEYFDLLASQSGRMQLFDMGITSEGRQMKYAVISSENTIENLERYRNITKTLSLAQVDSDAEAVSLAREGKAVVLIEGGMHSSETSPAMHQFQLAYDLVTGTDEWTTYILDNIILLLVIANPDGMTLIADWYMSNVGTPYEISSLPVLYNKYAGHDDNRDSFIANLAETQNMNRLTGMVWYPELFFSQHESAPFPARIWVPPNPEPVNPNMHPIIVRWKNLIGSAMGQGFEAQDKKGVISRTAFDLWYPGYSDGPSVEGHNIASILTETANYRYATPHYYSVNDFPAAYRDLTLGTFYTSPWEGGWWRFRDAVEYNLTASKSVLDVSAKYRYELLYYKYKMAKDVINKFSSEPPYGWIIPADQHDPNTTALMLERLINYGIDVYTADGGFNYNGIDYPQGTYIIPTSQPFGMYVKNILEKQAYPDLRNYPHLWQGVSRTVRFERPMAPYDGVGWTLPVQMGIKTHEMSTRLDISKSLLSEPEYPSGSVTGRGSHYVFSGTENNSFTAVNMIQEAGGEVSRALADFSMGNVNFANGSFIVNGGSISGDELGDIASSTGINFEGGRTNVSQKSLKQPRIALYKSWAANMDAGWISLILERYDFGYHPLTDADVKAGDLHNNFDVIILPDQSSSSIVNGHRKGTMPPDYVGGITLNGVENLRKFVENGGVLICNKASTDLPITYFNIPVKNILQSVPSDSFSSPGSLLRMKYDTSHPLTYGLHEDGMAYFSGGRVFEIVTDSVNTDGENDNYSVQIVASYPDESLLISGWLIGEDKIRKKAAILDVTYGEGTIIQFGFNFHNRMQSYANFKLLFNALYYE